MDKKLYSRKEIIKKFNLTKRMIETYEKKGLIQTKAKNKYGHNLYDDAQLKKIVLIRLLQDSGMHLNDIAKIIILEPNEFKLALKEIITKINQEINVKKKLISIINLLMKDTDNALEIIMKGREK